MNVLLVVFIGVALMVAVVLSRGKVSAKGRTGNFKGWNDAQSPERRLVGACFGDVSKAEGCIAYEIKRSFGAYSRHEAIEAALDRLERDRS